MNSKPEPSITASCWALLLALIAAWLVFFLGWMPETALAAALGGALALVAGGLVILLVIARTPAERLEAWTTVLETAKADLQPLLDLWRLIAGSKGERK